VVDGGSKLELGASKKCKEGREWGKIRNWDDHHFKIREK